MKDKSESVDTMEHLDADPSQQRPAPHPARGFGQRQQRQRREIVSGAIKDTGSGILVGEKTFGKGVVQSILSLPDGSAVKITTQHYYTAKKNDINHKGIEPDVKVTIPDDNQRKETAYYRAHSEALYDLQYDTQLQAGLTQMKQQMQGARARAW